MDEDVLKLNYEVACKQEPNLLRGDHFIRIVEDVFYSIPVYRSNIVYLDGIKSIA